MRPTDLNLLRRFLLPIVVVALPLASFGGRHAAGAPDEAAPVITLLSAVELDDLVAPVALYPDVVLDSLLPATVAPTDVAAAAVFAASQGGGVAAAPEGAAWDPSLVAMLQFPDVLQWMGDNGPWVEQMGFAVTMQQADVLVAIQRYRTTARTAGVLVTNPYTTVTVDPATVILIESTRPDVIYVPVYDPWLLRRPYIVSATPFFQTWFTFSFGGSGSWSRNRIFWGVGIYGYGDSYWPSLSRHRASDWGTNRPSRWMASRRGDQPWTRAGWNSSERVRPGTPRRVTSGNTNRTVYVSPPRSRSASRANVRPGATGGSNWRQPVAPAAPITRWRRSETPTVPPTPAPTPRPRAIAPVPAPRVGTPTPGVVDRRTVNGWGRRGRGSLEGGARVAPGASVPNVPTPRVVRTPAAPPRAALPHVRSLPTPRPKPPTTDGARARVYRKRGHQSLSGS